MNDRRPLRREQNPAYGTLQPLRSGKTSSVEDMQKPLTSASATFPPPVVRGDRIGIVALGGPVAAEAVEAGLDAVRTLGLEPVAAANLSARQGLFAGTDDDRLEAFHELAADPSLRAILFARGGHGLLRLLPRLDWEVLAKVPRFYVGYSDVTPFLNLVVERLGWVAVHGPMVAVEWAEGLDSSEVDSIQSILAGGVPKPQSITGVGGRATGILKGGCLSLLAATLGTEYATDFQDSVLFWEDTNEPLYRLDRKLTQLELAGALEGARGMVVGSADVSDVDTQETRLEEVLGGLSDRLARPVGWDLCCGHCRPNHSLPLGVRVRLDTEIGILAFEDGLKGPSGL